MTGAVPVRPNTMHEVTWPEDHSLNMATRFLTRPPSLSASEVSRLDLPWIIRGLPEDMPDWQRNRARPITREQLRHIEDNPDRSPMAWHGRRLSPSLEREWEVLRQTRFSRPSSRSSSFRTALDSGVSPQAVSDNDLDNLSSVLIDS